MGGQELIDCLCLYMKIRAAYADEPSRVPTYCLARCCQALCLLRGCGMEKISEGQEEITREEQNVESIDHQFVSLPVIQIQLGWRKSQTEAFLSLSAQGAMVTTLKARKIMLKFIMDQTLTSCQCLICTPTRESALTYMYIQKISNFIIPNVYKCIYIITKEKKLQK